MARRHLAQRFDVGDVVEMREEAIENYGERYRGQPLEITHVSTQYMPSREFFLREKPEGFHPGFDPESNSALYDLADQDFSLYDWEVKRHRGR